MGGLFGMLLRDGIVRARVLAGLTWAGAAASGALVPVLINHGVSSTDATSIGAAVGALILAAGSAVYGILVDPKNVDSKIANARAQGTQQAVNVVRSATNGSQTDALTQVLAKLESGTA